MNQPRTFREFIDLRCLTCPIAHMIQGMLNNGMPEGAAITLALTNYADKAEHFEQELMRMARVNLGPALIPGPVRRS